jgi:hypothetical protein
MRGEVDGYATVDALVALMILASTVIASVSASHGSRETADAALALRKADDLAAYLLETAPPTEGATAGQVDGFAWLRLVSPPVETYGAGAICERRVILTALRDQRRYEARANAICPAALDT